MKVDEIKDILISEFGIDEEDLRGLKKKELFDMLEECRSGSLLNNAISGLKDSSFEDMVSEIEESIEENAEITINYKELSQQEEIMSLFEEDELVDGKFPKVNGLRRVAALVIGNISNQSVKVEHIPCYNINDIGGTMATVGICFDCENPNFGKIGANLSFEAAADCIPDYNNINKNFKIFPTAIAETRAEARVYRKALKLDVVSAEELNDIDDDIETIKGDGKISNLKVVAIKKQCEMKKVDEKEVIGKTDKNSIEEFEESDFQAVMKYINKKGI